MPPLPPPGLGGAASDGASTPKPVQCEAATAEEKFRREVMSELEATLQSKIDDIMRRGRQMVEREGRQWQEKFHQVAAEVHACRQEMQALSAENLELRQAMTRITERLWSPPVTPGLGLFGDTEVVSPGFAPVPPFPIPCTAGGSPPAPPSPPPGAESAGEAASPHREAMTFSFTLRKADGADLGLSVSQDESEQVLRVEGIKEKGAVEAWNKCNAGGGKEVLPGDRVVGVNGVAYDPQAMLAECREKQLLRLTVVRGGPAGPRGGTGAAEPPATPKSLPPTTLRADASVFVPGLQSPGSEGTATSAGTEGAASSAGTDSGAENAFRAAAATAPQA